MTTDEINRAIGELYGWQADYCGDLNAMHEAEKVLTTFDEWDIYCVHLGDTQPSCAKATARQRAEAFLRTLGKWEPVVKHPFTTDGDHLGDVNKMVGEVQP